jgi:hypothetical protein
VKSTAKTVNQAHTDDVAVNKQRHRGEVSPWLREARVDGSIFARAFPLRFCYGSASLTPPASGSKQVSEVVVTLQSVLLRLLPLPPPGRALAESEWSTLVRIAEVLLPSTTELPPEDVADNVERFLVRGRSKRAWRVRALLELVEWLPVTECGKPFSRMTASERRRLVEERYMEGLGLWGICAKIRYLVFLGAYGDTRLHGPTSYVPVSKRRRFMRVESNGGGAVSP